MTLIGYGCLFYPDKLIEVSNNMLETTLEFRTDEPKIPKKFRLSFSLFGIVPSDDLYLNSARTVRFGN